MSEEDKSTVDWKHWANVPAWTHLQALALSCDVEPVEPQSVDAVITCSTRPGKPRSDLSQTQIRDRYQFIRVHFPKEEPVPRLDFVRWAVDRGTAKLPTEMVEMLGNDRHWPRYSIAQIVKSVAEQEGWHADAREQFRNDLQAAAGNTLPCGLANYPLDGEPGSAHLLELDDVSPWIFKHRDGVIWPKEKADSPTAPASAPEDAPPSKQWKMRVQAEAAAEWKRLRTMNCNPTRAAIRPHLLKWCKLNNVKTDGGLNPSDGYLRTHVLSGKHWTPPAE